jgi:undecaprenyl pyrophosphate synthase
MRDGPSPKNPIKRDAKQFNGRLTKRAESLRNVPSKNLNQLAAARRKTMPSCVKREIKIISSYVFQKFSTQRRSSSASSASSVLGFGVPLGKKKL